MQLFLIKEEFSSQNALSLVMHRKNYRRYRLSTILCQFLLLKEFYALYENYSIFISYFLIRESEFRSANVIKINFHY